ncbi:MAG: prepilin-type N-terminal cleavage/methylation domain-containing protein [Planctomycetota bacterium]
MFGSGALQFDSVSRSSTGMIRGMAASNAQSRPRRSPVVLFGGLAPKQMCASDRRRRAFTLIELLVTISIIALLIGILLPAMSSATEAARRAACLSRQKQFFVAVSLYAEDFDEQVPLGHSLGPGEGWKQYNYLLRTAAPGRDPAPRWMGLLFAHGAFEVPEVAYCPSERDELFSFDTRTNPWISRLDEPGEVSTRIGFGVRPLIGWPFPAGREMPTGLPRRADLGVVGRTAIAADQLHKPDRVEGRHRDGVNTLFHDGSAEWTALQRFDSAEGDGRRWSDTLGASFDVGFNALFLSEGNDRSVWSLLDR